MIISRIAPTPSGFLHTGNALNFLLTYYLVKQNNGELWLRIDDADGDRCKKEYVEDVFRVLDWLKIEWNHGPQGVDDFFKNFSQQKKKDYYWEQFEDLQKNSNRFFACECSRSQVMKASEDGLYPGTCLNKKLKFKAGKTSVRFHVDQENKSAEMGDFVVWRKDDAPAYQLFSLVDDLDMKINYIVRGSDLCLSTYAQQDLARAWGERGLPFLETQIFHHPLIELEGKKLSKSQDHPSFERSASELEFIQEQVDVFLECMV